MQKTRKRFTILEIENEKYEREDRAKNERIQALESQARHLNEKLLILQMDHEQKHEQAQEIKGRLKLQLKEYSEELLALKKQRNSMFIQRMEEMSQTQRKMIKAKLLREKRKGQEHAPEDLGKGEGERLGLESAERKMIRGQTSIWDLRAKCREMGGSGGKKKKLGQEVLTVCKAAKGLPLTSVDQICSKKGEESQSRKKKENQR